MKFTQPIHPTWLSLNLKQELAKISAYRCEKLMETYYTTLTAVIAAKAASSKKLLKESANNEPLVFRFWFEK